MKSKQEIETKLQDVEAHILNMEEAARASEDKKDEEIYTAARDAAIEQAKAIKWILS